MFLECVVCGKSFESEALIKTCSDECAKERKKASSRKHYQSKRALTVKICSECGKEFLPSKRHVSICSLECKMKKQPYRYKKDAVVKMCRCGNTFETDNSCRIHCSKACAVQSHKDLMKRRNKEMLIGNETIIVDAKCPGCGIIHKKEILAINVSNVMPRYYCDRFPSCSDNFYSINFESAWHSNNRAMI